MAFVTFPNTQPSTGATPISVDDLLETYEEYARGAAASLSQSRRVADELSKCYSNVLGEVTSATDALNVELQAVQEQFEAEVEAATASPLVDRCKRDYRTLIEAYTREVAAVAAAAGAPSSVDVSGNTRRAAEAYARSVADLNTEIARQVSSAYERYLSGLARATTDADLTSVVASGNEELIRVMLTSVAGGLDGNSEKDPATDLDAGAGTTGLAGSPNGVGREASEGGEVGDGAQSADGWEDGSSHPGDDAVAPGWEDAATPAWEDVATSGSEGVTAPGHEGTALSDGQDSDTAPMESPWGPMSAADWGEVVTPVEEEVESEEEPVATLTEPAKKAAAKKTTAKKGAAKKTTAKKGAAKKTTANKGAAKKTTAKKTTAKKAAAKKTTDRSSAKPPSRRTAKSTASPGPATKKASRPGPS